MNRPARIQKLKYEFPADAMAAARMCREDSYWPVAVVDRLNPPARSRHDCSTSRQTPAPPAHVLVKVAADSKLPHTGADCPDQIAPPPRILTPICFYCGMRLSTV